LIDLEGIMAKRRGHGEGSVYQRSDGRWTAYITLDNRKRKYFYGKTRKEVVDKLQKAQREKHQGTLITTPDQRLEDYLTHWLDTYKPTVRLATYNIKSYIVRGHIIPAIGHIPLQRLTPQHIRAFYASEMNNGLKPQTVRGYHLTLHRALAQAVKDGLIARNVCDLVDPPKPLRREMQTLNEEQARHLLETAKGHRLEFLLTLAIATGMREGEMLALRWSDIDMDKGVLFVRRTVKRVGKYGIVETEPKTARSRRQIALPDFVIAALKAHKEKQEALRLKMGKRWRNKELVICNHFGDVIDTANLTHWFKKLLKQAELPNIRFHDLRHSAATLLLAMDVHPKIVQELLGHSSIAITMDVYSHALPSMHQEAMRKMDGIFRET
jgi:integrase